MNNTILKSKKILFYVMMIVLTFALGFIILEYGLARYYCYSIENEISNITFDPIIGWRSRPATYWIKPAHSFTKHILCFEHQMKAYSLFS